MLSVLDLPVNSFSGYIPCTPGNLRNLQSLNLAENDLITESSTSELDIIKDLTNCKYFRYIDLSSNPMNAFLLNSLGNLSTSLEYFRIQSSGMKGSIPTDIGNFTELTLFSLSFNPLARTIPASIGKLQNLRVLYISDNQLEGSIPSELFHRKNLAALNLGNNIPTCLVNLTSSRRSLLLYSNSLISSEYLDLFENKLSGVIPKSLEALVNLKYFIMSFNKLHSEIPSNGAFRNVTAQSFIGNVGLCSPSHFRVPQCQTVEPGKSRTSKLLKFILSPIAAIMFVAALAFAIVLQATNDLAETNLLGTGSFGRVYKGWLSDEMDIAVKVFNLQQEDAFQSFDVECEIFQHIRHQNLVKIISSCSNNYDFKALLLSYIPKGSLEKGLYSYNYCLSILKRLNIMIDVAAALDYLHNGNPTPIVHCDLKPSNVLLDEDMVAQVTDFGMAKHLGGFHNTNHYSCHYWVSGSR
ncbi:receptor kinase-like protein Xa21 [Quillaja saponaria]|uniref:Receptor kinase-like protein Xa21 n=1 Tax=Quillaja saponaria TaxID=32244 RepID=A0AAD7P9X9_QUISA|nr:receptor kinase-like protein Xa21 [Quillaja saponaria]